MNSESEIHAQVFVRLVLTRLVLRGALNCTWGYVLDPPTCTVVSGDADAEAGFRPMAETRDAHAV